MTYHFDLVCPRCGKTAKHEGEKRAPSPRVNCGDCLWNDTEIVQMKVVRVTTPDQTADDCKVIADAFRQIYKAAMRINEVLGRNDALNETVPTGWPLNLSADEFAAECQGMAEHYEEMAKEAVALNGEEDDDGDAVGRMMGENR